MDEKGKVHCTSSVFNRLDPAVPHTTGLCVSSHKGQGEDGASAVSGSFRGTLPHNVKQEKVVLNQVPAFDSDVDDIFCLNPLCSKGFSEKVEGLASDGAAVAHRQELESGNGREGVKTGICLNVTDEGYLSLSQLKDNKVATCQLGFHQLPTATSSPLPRMGEDKRPQGECRPESASKKVSFSVSDVCSPDSGLSLKSAISDSLDGDDEEMLNVGPPIFESSVCYSVTVKVNADSEQSRQVTEDVKPGVVELLHDSLDTTHGDQTTSDTSCDTTLPLQVQVKSVVVNSAQRSTSSSSRNKAAPPLPEQKASHTDKNVCSDKRPRLARFDKEMDWECEKRHYVHLVNRHINEHLGAHQDVMSELHNLMTHVAERTPDTSGRQHPSDLTRRNYQRRFGNKTANMTLHEWQEKNLKTNRRFARVPKYFQRSPYP